jgi:hypothetical protein
MFPTSTGTCSIFPCGPKQIPSQYLSSDMTYSLHIFCNTLHKNYVIIWHCWSYSSRRSQYHQMNFKRMIWTTKWLDSNGVRQLNGCQRQSCRLADRSVPQSWPLSFVSLPRTVCLSVRAVDHGSLIVFFSYARLQFGCSVHRKQIEKKDNVLEPRILIKLLNNR